jgi:PhnB protein
MSTIQLSPYINFQGRAREALEFYHQVLGGTLALHTINAQGVAGPAGPGDRITQGRLAADGVLLLGGDGHPAYPAQVGDNLALALSGTDHDRLTQIFHALATGGILKMPPTAQPGGALVGWLTDQFGINWMVQIDPT